MEREMCGYPERVLNVKPEDLRYFKAMVRKKHGSASTAPAPVALSIPRQPNPYPLPVSTPPSPSLSNSASPASSTCQTPPSAHSPVEVPTKDVTPVKRSQPFAYTAPSV
ncbi:hypothetical protein FRC09_007733 [Ceratobasidium sp. 395]|nr:hypothetical protein FRC09_007733 [Ceratobasidium sp. 395]